MVTLGACLPSVHQIQVADFHTRLSLMIIPWNDMHEIVPKNLLLYIMQTYLTIITLGHMGAYYAPGHQIEVADFHTRLSLMIIQLNDMHEIVPKNLLLSTMDPYLSVSTYITLYLCTWSLWGHVCPPRTKLKWLIFTQDYL